MISSRLYIVAFLLFITFVGIGIVDTFADGTKNRGPRVDPNYKQGVPSFTQVIESIGQGPNFSPTCSDEVQVGPAISRDLEVAALVEKLTCVARKKMEIDSSRLDESKENIELVAPLIIDMFKRHEILEGHKNMMLAHMITETGSFIKMEQKRDGEKKYKEFLRGRGMFHLTGCSNYMSYAYYLAHPGCKRPSDIQVKIGKKGFYKLDNKECVVNPQDKQVSILALAKEQHLSKSDDSCLPRKGKDETVFNNEGMAFYDNFEKIGHPTGEIIFDGKSDWYYAVDSAGWFWKNSSRAKEISENVKMVKTIPVVTGGDSGTDDRLKNYSMLNKIDAAVKSGKGLICEQLLNVK